VSNATEQRRRRSEKREYIRWLGTATIERVTCTLQASDEGEDVGGEAKPTVQVCNCTQLHHPLFTNVGDEEAAAKEHEITYREDAVDVVLVDGLLASPAVRGNHASGKLLAVSH
jgi:hypothetical protein